MSSLLEIRGVEAVAGSFHLSIDAVITSGATGIFGPSGAGKTTLLEIIAGLRRPVAGKLVVNNRTLFDQASHEWIPAHQRRIGYVPQDVALFPHLTVRKNILYGVEAGRRGDSAPPLDALCAVLEIGSLLDRYPHTLSGGEKQRVAFARALLPGPELLLLDEPLTGLDRERKAAIMNYLVKLRREFPVPLLYVTHSPEEVMALCEEVLVLRDGKIHAHGPCGQLFVVDNAPSYRLRADC